MPEVKDNTLVVIQGKAFLYLNKLKHLALKVIFYIE